MSWWAKLLALLALIFGGGRPGAASGGAAPGLPVPPKPWPIPVPVTAIGDAIVTPALLMRLGVAADAAVQWAPAIAAACAQFQITTKKRVALFLANVLHESGGLARLEENLNYSVAGLLGNFGRHRISAEDCERLGRKVGQASLNTAQQNAIADLVYGGDYGLRELGNTQPGDGSRFKGRGLIQATGRGMYANLAAAFRFGDELAVRDWLMTRDGAALSAAWIWTVEKRCNPLADAGDVRGARKKINGGDKGLEEVTALNARALEALA